MLRLNGLPGCREKVFFNLEKVRTFPLKRTRIPIKLPMN